MDLRRMPERGNALRFALVLVLAAAGQILQPCAGASSTDQPDEQSRAAAAEGHVDRELQLAGDYLAGRGDTRNPERAVFWYRKAAVAENDLAIAYFLGYGVPADHRTAEKWFERAAKQQLPEAEYAMGTLYSVVDDMREADAWIAQHHDPAIFISGNRFQTGNFPLPEVPALDLLSGP
jgi:TPR repeat protein